MNNQLWNNYKKFYISQSTAFITPVLYIFLNNRFQITTSSILQISALYWMLSIIMQIPCGILADRWGTKKNLYACLALQILSCISLLVIPNVIAYHFYLICIYLAEGFCVSASSILIRKQFKDSEEEKFKEYSFNLQNAFYLSTAGFIILASYLFTLNIYIPFILQIINFFVSGYYLNKIPEQYISNEKTNRGIFYCGKEDLRKSIRFILSEKGYLYLIICAIFFGLGVSINQKAIQLQLFSLFEENKIVMIGCVIAIGNLFSSVGSKYFYSYISKQNSIRFEIMILMLTLVISYLLMSIDSLITVITGFMIINAFKGCYRPLINSELVNRYPFTSSRSTNLALISLAGIIASSVLQLVFSFFYHNIYFGNISFVALTCTILVIASKSLKRISSWQIPDGSSKLTGKENFILKKNGELVFSQIYPVSFSHQDLTDIGDIAVKSGYPHQKLIPVIIANRVGIETKFLGETRLSDIVDEGKQYLICRELLHNFQPSYHLIRPAKIIREEHILPPTILETVRKDSRLSKSCIIHGDLHPDNIMVFDDQPNVIDWDLCGTGPLWYDLLTLLSHPNLYFNKQKRYELFLMHCDLLTKEDLDTLFHLFCIFKNNQIKNFAKYDIKYQKLANFYFDQIHKYA